MTSKRPFKCEYAKSNRSGCKAFACGMQIEKNELRVATYVQVRQ